MVVFSGDYRNVFLSQVYSTLGGYCIIASNRIDVYFYNLAAALPSSQLLAGGDTHLLSGLDLERDTSRYYYLTMGGEASTTTSTDKKLYNEVRRAMGVSWRYIENELSHA